MVKETVILCDICREVAHTQCFMCGNDICSDHNIGGKHAEVYDYSTFNVDVDDNFMDCCPQCSDKLKVIAGKKWKIFEEKMESELQNIKKWLLEEIKKENSENR